MNGTETYDPTTVALHWITALSVVVLWIIGQTADWIPDGPVNTAYWSVHVVLGFVLAGRTGVADRLARHPPVGVCRPPMPAPCTPSPRRPTTCCMRCCSTVVVLGVVNAFVRGYNLFDLVNLPQVGDRAWRRPITQWHGLAANILLGLALFHAAAALVHHYLWKDGVLRRMLPAKSGPIKVR